MPSPRCRGFAARARRSVPMPATRPAASRTTMLSHCCWRRVAGAVAVLCPVLVGSVAARGDGPAPSTGPTVPWREYRQTVQPFFAKHCFACHTDEKSGDVRLDLFSDEKALARGLPTLEKALGMLRKHAMPPRRRPQPSSAETKPVLAWLE